MTKPSETTQPPAREALEGIRASLRESNPQFERAEAIERGAEALCTKVRRDLREKRKSIRIDQATVAERMDLAQSAISRIENGKGDIGLKTLYRYSNALGFRPVLLFVSTPSILVEGNQVPAAAETVDKFDEIASAQDMFLRKMSEMVPELTAHKLKSA